MAIDEPIIDLEDVQGNVYPGFNKDHQTLKLLAIADLPPARLALGKIASDVSTSAVVRAYSLVRAAIKAQRAGGPSNLTATWMNIAFGYRALALLSSS